MKKDKGKKLSSDEEFTLEEWKVVTEAGNKVDVRYEEVKRVVLVSFLEEVKCGV